MAKFHYAPIPSTVLCNPALSASMKLRYGILIGAAFNKQTLKMSLAEIGALWAEAEGTTLDIDSVTAYLGKMAQAGLIRRERQGRYNWITHLLQRYDKRTTNKQTANTQTNSQHTNKQPQHAPPAQDLTPTPHGGQNHLTPTGGSGSLLTTLDVVVVSKSLSQQQQQLVSYLERFGILAKTALSLALLGVDLEDAVYWVEYTKLQANLRSPTGFVITKLSSREEPPDIAIHGCPLCRCSPCTCGFWEKK
ncbi:MAG: hypothetical protein H8D74_01120 [Chloroflexi bacterium]|nr:hypothetical protein [Chloroflexota bacterium]